MLSNIIVFSSLLISDIGQSLKLFYCPSFSFSQVSFTVIGLTYSTYFFNVNKNNILNSIFIFDNGFLVEPITRISALSFYCVVFISYMFAQNP